VIVCLVGKPAQRLFHESTRPRLHRAERLVSAQLFLRQVGRSQRNRDNEGRPFPDLALRGDGAAVKVDQFVNQRQADAAPFVRASMSIFDPMESFK
jgi:hypothetical protein